MLSRKTVVITGIVTPDSIATATLSAALHHGASVIATAFPRDLDAARAVVDAIDPSVRVVPLDLTDRPAVDRFAAELRGAGTVVDGALHAVAFAPRGALSGSYTGVDSGDVEVAFRSSVWTYAVLAHALTPLMTRGGSLVGLDFDAGGRAWPVYNWMGACKAALREASRYIARDGGALGIRSNLVAAGPLLTRAASGIADFDTLTSAFEATTPLRWDPTDAQPVADAVCFLLSDLARAITGEVLHVDGGFNAMATARPA